MTPEKLLERIGFPNCAMDTHALVDVWKTWYMGKVNNFHKYKVYNGKTYVKCERMSLGMAKRVAEDWGSLLLNEKTLIMCADKETEKQLNLTLNKNNFWVKGNQAIEHGCAMGTVALVLTLESVEINTDTNEIVKVLDDSIRIDTIEADRIFPISWNNREITECAFLINQTNRGKDYDILNVHTKNSETGMYEIRNYVFDSNGNNVGNPDLVEFFDTRSTNAWFYIFKPNISSNLFNNEPLGVSLFANAIDNLKGVDLAYDGYCNELNLGKKRVYVSAEAVTIDTIDGTRHRVFDPNDVVHYTLPAGIDGKPFVEDVTPSLRSQEYGKAVQDHLNYLSSNCGLGSNYYNFEKTGLITATQVISDKDDLFRNKKKHDTMVYDFLLGLVKGILFVEKEFLGKKVDTETEIIITMDDSIIEDTNAEKTRDLSEINAGVLSKWEYRNKWYGEDEETAKEKIQEIQSSIPILGDNFGNG